MHHYQNHAVEYIKDKKKCALFLDMGLGKTAITLTAIKDFIDDGFINRALIIAPLRVANTVWHVEAKKWSHLQDLNIAVCTGSAKRRMEKITSKADIQIINRENTPWLINAKIEWPWNMLVIDESTSFKNPKSLRFRSIKTYQKMFQSIVLLTGTPSPNGLQDLWSQIFLIDRGERLGRTLTAFRSRYFVKAGYNNYEYHPKPFSDRLIRRQINDICLRMDAKDYLELPDCIKLTERVEFPRDVWKQYQTMERKFILSLDDVKITAFSATAVALKLLQICNGAVYNADGEFHQMHDGKLQVLKELMDENPNENFLVAYNFRSDLERLKTTFPDAVVLSRSGKEIDEWNAGKIQMLLAHPQSAGHGLNAQHGGSIVVWFGLNWSLELYEQFNSRIYRQGQTKPVRIIHLVANRGIDEKIIKALDRKAKTQNDLLKYLRMEIPDDK